MSAHNYKRELAFKLPEMLSYHSTWDDADYEPVLPRRRRPLRDGFTAAYTALASLRRRALAMNELHGMSDRELADIGINRYDIARIDHPDFAREHASRGR